jgi:hypothetical protein
MFIAFYGYLDGKIEPLGAGDTDFSGFFFSADFRDLCRELEIPRYAGKEAYDNDGCYCRRVKGYDDKFFYIVNPNFDFDSVGKEFKPIHYRNIKHAVRDYKTDILLNG